MTPPTEPVSNDDSDDDNDEVEQSNDTGLGSQEEERDDLGFAETARRFTEAEAALGELQDHIKTLAGLQEQQARNADALNHTAEAVAPLGDLAVELLSSLKAAVEASKVIFDTDSPRDIRNDIAAATSVATLGNEAIRRDIADLVRAFETRHDAIAAERDELRQQLATIQMRIDGMPVRRQRKLGFIS